MNSRVIYIGFNDTPEEVKNKIRKTQKEKVILVLPEENNNLKKEKVILDLKKETQGKGKELTIFSTDSIYKKLAEKCGIKVEASLIGESFFGKEKTSFQPKISDILPRRETINLKPEIKKEPKEEIPFQKKEQKSERITGEKKQRSTKRKTLSFLIYFFFFFLVGGIIAFSLIYLPRVDIEIVSPIERIEFQDEFMVKANADLNLEERVIPGKLVEKIKEEEKDFFSTGKEKRVDKAKGKIIIYNEYSSFPQALISGTRFLSKEGKIFKLTKKVNIPGAIFKQGKLIEAGKTEAEVIADEAGEEYNIPPTTFTIPGYKDPSRREKIYGKSSEPIKGGFIGEAKIITEDDIKKTEEELMRTKETLFQPLKESLIGELSQDFRFLEDFIVITEEEITFDKKSGEISESFKGKVKIKGKILDFEDENIQKIIAQIIKNKIRKDIKPEEILSSQKVQYKVLECNIGQGFCRINFEGEQVISWKFMIQEIKEKIKGLNQEEYKRFIEKNIKNKIKKVITEFWPMWVNKIPERKDRIFIEVKYE